MTGPVVPPGGEELREAMRAALRAHRWIPRDAPDGHVLYDCSCGQPLSDSLAMNDHRADEAAKVADAEGRRRAAEELLAAADLVARAPGVKHQGGAVHALRTRAAALQPHAVPRAFVTGDVVPACCGR